MNLPEQPATFREPGPAERPWWWRLEDTDGTPVDGPSELAEQRFPSQGDAESWLGECFGDLLAGGVEQVTLFDLERRVYGPMSLRA